MIIKVIQVVNQLTNCLIKVYLKWNFFFPLFLFFNVHSGITCFLVLIEVILEAPFLEVIHMKNYCYIFSSFSFYDKMSSSQKGYILQLLSISIGK